MNEMYGNRSKVVAIFLGIAIVYILTIISSWMQYPELHLWNKIDFTFLCIAEVEFTFFKTLHLTLGTPLILMGTFHVWNVIKINSSASDGRLYVHTLLIEGYYRQIRHPMYANFIHLQIGLFFGLCSVLAIPFALIFSLIFWICAVYEEKDLLLPKFQIDYFNYMENTKSRFLSTKYRVIYSLYFGITLMGLYFT
jgi:protein-S-isoprenylcysteine O-methyltransferase Ste14